MEALSYGLLSSEIFDNDLLFDFNNEIFGTNGVDTHLTLQESITGNSLSAGDTDERSHKSDLWDDLHAPLVCPSFSEHVYTGPGVQIERKKESKNKVLGYGSKTLRESSIILQTRSAIDILDDGYRWRKYGQKVVKENPNPRSRMESLPSNTDNGTKKPCGACRERRCRCDSSCVFAGVIPYDEPHRYRALNEHYNIKWVEELLRFASLSLSREYIVERLLAKDSSLKDYLFSLEPSALNTGGRGTKRSRLQPCGACKEKKRECNPTCVFAGAIPYEEPEKYRTLKKVFNIKRLEKLLRPLSDDLRVDVVKLFLSEAESLIKELSPGCGNHNLPGLASLPPMPMAMDMAPPQDVWQQDLGLMDNLLPFCQQHENQLESWEGTLMS